MLSMITLVHMLARPHMHQEYMMVLQGAHVECEGLSKQNIAYRLHRRAVFQLAF